MGTWRKARSMNKFVGVLCVLLVLVPLAQCQFQSVSYKNVRSRPSDCFQDTNSNGPDLLQLVNCLGVNRQNGVKADRYRKRKSAMEENMSDISDDSSLVSWLKKLFI